MASRVTRTTRATHDASQGLPGACVAALRKPGRGGGREAVAQVSHGGGGGGGGDAAGAGTMNSL